MATVTLIDYNVNNLFSVCRAFERVGAHVTVTQDPSQILSADRLVLPGVGSFKDGMDRLRRLGLVQPIAEYVRSGKPLLGFCLGMQLLAEEGEEFGLHQGLGLIRGRVIRFPRSAGEKVPHVGWNSLRPGNFPSDSSWHGSILEGVPTGSDVYFVHSYIFEAENVDDVLAITDYAGIHFASVLASGNIHGCQFHPEKSGPTGLRIITNFALRT